MGGVELERREGRFSGAGGVDLYWQAWVPLGGLDAVVVLAHGGGEHSGRYGNVVDHLVPRRYAIYALDHRGHGCSGGRRATIDRFSQYVDDLDAFVELVRKEQAESPIVVLGHSLGAAIGLSFALEHPEGLDALVLSGAPVVISDDVSRVQLSLGRVLSRVAPRLPLVKIDSTKVSRDPDVVRAYDADPLVFHGKLDARMAGELLRVVESFPDRVGELRVPVLCLHGSRDELADPKGSEMLIERADSNDKTLHVYDGMYHEVFNELGLEQVLADLEAWLASRFGVEAEPGP